MFNRFLERKLLEMIDFFPIVLLMGPRQSGKTTLVKMIKDIKEYTYVTFDDLKIAASANSDPLGFVSQLKLPVIIDEVQKCPEIFHAIKQKVDENRKASMFVLTGSANPLMIPKISESLSGRIGLINLWPLSFGEIIRKREKFIDQIFNENFSYQTIKKITKNELILRFIKGGFPTIQQDLSFEMINEWCNSYLTTILQRDIKNLANIEKVSDLSNLMQFLSIRSSNLINFSELSRTSKIAGSTLKRYLNLLQTLFIIYFHQPWHNNLTKRLVKATKLYLVDTALLINILSIDQKRLEMDSNLFGQILENYISIELHKIAIWSKKNIKFYHYRNQGGEEIDIILESSLKEVVAIEIKASSNVKPDDFKAIKNLQNQIKDNLIKGIVLYMGDQIIPFGQNIYAMPINSLWDL